jgi:HK97 family phage portal protein
MGIARALIPSGRPPERRDSLENPSVDLVTALVAETDGTSVTSISLTPAKSLRLTAVYAAVRVIAESCASLPLPIYSRDGSSRKMLSASADDRWSLLNDSPNEEMTSMELWETWFGHALLWGKGYQYVVRNGAGRPIELWPLRPDRTQAHRTESGRLFYTTLLDTGQPAILQAEEVMVCNSIFGLSPIKVARESLTASIAAEEYAGRFWANNARPGGIIKLDGKLTDPEYDEFRRRWRAGHEGLKRGQLIGILTGGASWQDVGISPGLAQFLETREFGVREVARLFRVPPHVIGDLKGTVTRASIEQQAIEFVVYTLRPWLVRGEQAIRKQLFNLTADLKGEIYPEFQVQALMRGDIKSRYDAYAAGIQFGFLSRADVRQMENLPVVEGHHLEDFLVPLNMGPSGDLGDAKPEPAPEDTESMAALRRRLLAEDHGIEDPEGAVDAGEHAAALAELEETRELLARAEQTGATGLLELERAMAELAEARQQLARRNGHSRRR